MRERREEKRVGKKGEGVEEEEEGDLSLSGKFFDFWFIFVS